MLGERIARERMPAGPHQDFSPNVLARLGVTARGRLALMDEFCAHRGRVFMVRPQ